MTCMLRISSLSLRLCCDAAWNLFRWLKDLPRLHPLAIFGEGGTGWRQNHPLASGLGRPGQRAPDPVRERPHP